MLADNVARRGDAPGVRRRAAAGDLSPRQASLGDRGRCDEESDSGRALHHLQALSSRARKLAIGDRLFRGTTDSWRHTDSFGVQGGTRVASAPGVTVKGAEPSAQNLSVRRMIPSA